MHIFAKESSPLRPKFVHWVGLCCLIVQIWAEPDPKLQQLANTFRQDLAYRLEFPLCEARDVTDALKWYLKGRSLLKTDPAAAITSFREGISVLEKGAFPFLPLPELPPFQEDVTIEFIQDLEVPPELWEMNAIKPLGNILFHFVRFRVENLLQYGVIIRPKTEQPLPLLLYGHGAAYGVPDYALPWCAKLADRGYVVGLPAFRGENAFLTTVTKGKYPDLKGEGTIENLDGEVRDLLGMARGMQKLNFVRKGRYGLIGHSFGAGVCLLAAAQSNEIACVVSYDAWLVNPFRFYWERLVAEGNYENKSYLWGSWDDFINQLSAEDQLKGLLKRSIVHQAHRVEAPLLLFVGGAYNGSAYHYSHRELVLALERAKKVFRYKIVEGGGHNFVLYPDKEPAKIAYRIQEEWLNQYFPPMNQTNE